MSELQLILEEVQGAYKITLMRPEDSVHDTGFVASVPCLAEAELKLLHEQARRLKSKIGGYQRLRDEAVTLGGILFMSLMATPDIREAYHQALDEVRSERAKGKYSVLHLKLDLRTTDIAVLPWELMWDPKDEPYVIG